MTALCLGNKITRYEIGKQRISSRPEALGHGHDRIQELTEVKYLYLLLFAVKWHLNFMHHSFSFPHGNEMAGLLHLADSIYHNDFLSSIDQLLSVGLK